MDPVTLSLLISGGIAGAKAIAGAIPTKYDKENKAAIARLEDPANQGLSDRERQVRSAALMNPVRQAGADSEAANARALAAGGLTSGAAIAAGQQRTNQIVGQAGMQAKEYLDQADQQKRRAQQQELAARQAAQEQRRTDRKDAITAAAAEGAQAVGQFAGSPPETTRMYGLFGAKVVDPMKAVQDLPKALPQEDRGYIAQLISDRGDDMGKILTDSIRGRTSSSNYDARLADIIRRSNNLRTIEGLGLTPPAGPVQAPGGAYMPYPDPTQPQGFTPAGYLPTGAY